MSYYTYPDPSEWIVPALIVIVIVGLALLFAVGIVTGDSYPAHSEAEFAEQAVLLGYGHWEKEGSHRRFHWNQPAPQREAPP